MSNNSIINWSDGGMILDGNTEITQHPTVSKLNATILHNTISSTTGNFGVLTDYMNALSIIGNTITIPDGVNPFITFPIGVSFSKTATINNNTLANGLVGIDLTAVNSSTFLLNQISNVLVNAVSLTCSGNNLFLGNTMAPSPPGTNAIGVNLIDSADDPEDCDPSPAGSDNNRMLFNTFDGFCAGVGKGSSLNVGTVVLDDTFNNDGVHEVSGNDCF